MYNFKITRLRLILHDLNGDHGSPADKLIYIKQFISEYHTVDLQK